MKFPILFVSLLIALLAGCSNEEENLRTIEQAVLKSDISPQNIVYTEEIDDTAFSIYHSNDGFGVLHFDKEEDGWLYQGHSGFWNPEDTEERAFTLGGSTWVVGPYSVEGNSYMTVFLGEVYAPEINTITVQANHEEEEAVIITSDEGNRLWYKLYEQRRELTKGTIITGYDDAGEIVYQREIGED